MIWAWFLHYTGSSNETGPWYGFWSGFGSDLGEVTLLGFVAAAWRKHNCHDKGCWRLGRHVVDGTPWCDRHHQQARAAVAQASAGAGGNPAAAGFTADKRVVPPAAARAGSKT